MRKCTTRKHIEQPEYTLRSLVLQVGKLFRINARQHDVCTETVDHEEEERVENADSQVLDLENVFYCLNEVLDTMKLPAEVIDETELRNTSLQRHLASFKSAFAAVTGT